MPPGSAPIRRGREQKVSIFWKIENQCYRYFYSWNSLLVGLAFHKARWKSLGYSGGGMSAKSGRDYQRRQVMDELGRDYFIACRRSEIETGRFKA